MQYECNRRFLRRIGEFLSRADKSVILVIVLLLALNFGLVSTYAQESIIIEGYLENGTAGADIPNEMTITLNVFRMGDNLETMESVSQPGGYFKFEGVPSGNGFGYIVGTHYSGAFYSYESDYPLPSTPFRLVIYESTSSGESIKVRSHTLLINSANVDTETINALELVSVENTNDHTFIADMTQASQMDFLRFSLPPGTRELGVQTSIRGGEILQVDRGFAITTPVPPGNHEIAYTFQSSYSDGKMIFNHAFPFGTDLFRVLILHGLGQARGDGLDEMEDLVLGDRVYHLLEAHDLSIGEKVALEFTKLPEPSIWQRILNFMTNQKSILVSIPVAASVALFALLAYVLLRKKEHSGENPWQRDRNLQHAALVESIAQLDDLFQSGKISKEEYHEKRRGLKDQVYDHAMSWFESRSNTDISTPISETTPKNITRKESE